MTQVEIGNWQVVGNGRVGQPDYGRIPVLNRLVHHLVDKNEMPPHLWPECQYNLTYRVLKRTLLSILILLSWQKSNSTTTLARMSKHFLITIFDISDHFWLLDQPGQMLRNSLNHIITLFPMLISQILINCTKKCNAFPAGNGNIQHRIQEKKLAECTLFPTYFESTYVHKSLSF